jgi:hypothetical protein
MKITEQAGPGDLNGLLKGMESLRERLDRLESKIDILERSPVGKFLTPQYGEEDEEENTAERPGLETNIGEIGFAWVSSIVLIFSVIFLMVLLRKTNGTLASIAGGLAATVVVFLLSRLLRKRFSWQVDQIRTGILLLLYYISLRLHFFDSEPLITSLPVSLAILAIPIGLQFAYAIRQRSQFLTIVGLAMLILAGWFSNVTGVILLAGMAATLLSMVLLWQYNWAIQVYFALVLVYLNHLLWLFGNPAGSQVFGIRQTPGINLLFLYGYGILFSSGVMLVHKKDQPAGFSIAVTLLNAIGFSMILALETTAFYPKTYPPIYAIITVCSLGFSVLLKLRERHPFITAFYACVSFMALSIAIYGYAGLPGSYLWLALQSLLVVSVALWFRIQLIVWANTFLYLGILAFYLVRSPSADPINFMFVAVALVTARFLNWQKERLTLKTDILRNLYLFSAFLMMLYSLFKALPDNLVALSWVGAAAFYFILSLLLKILKYRYLAVGTLIAAIIHLFLVDMKHMEAGFRVVAFLVVALISLGGSIFYTSLRTKKKAERESEL